MTNESRDQYNDYLEKPLELPEGGLPTTQSISATALSSGGLNGDLILKNSGNISLYDDEGNLSIFIGFENE